VSQQQTQQQAALTELQAELAASIQDAQDRIEALLPSHKQDTALVELLVQKVQGARTKAAAALSSNTQAADSIDAVLGELQGCLAQAAACQQQQQQPGAGAARDECLQLLSTTNKLRQQLLRQSQVRAGR
jgi:hypothetical protein